jgi:hypothetical protein
MQLAQVLDVFEGMLVASEHPDIASVGRYGRDLVPGGQSPAGVKVQHQSGSWTYLFGAIHPGEIPVPIPDVLPRPKLRAPRMAIFAAQLLDVARPDVFRSWQLVAFQDLGHERGVTPLGISLVCSDGTKMLLRATAGSGPTDPEDEPAPEYRIPEGVQQWHLRVSSSTRN